MATAWRKVGESVGTIDLRELIGDSIVVHFGGEPRSVNAYTFANALIAFANAATAVNSVIDPYHNVELILEETGPGSFRAKVKKKQTFLTGLFAQAPSNFLWMIIGLLLQQYLFATPLAKITINTDDVIFDNGSGDRVIVPRAVYDQMSKVSSDEKVQKEVKRTFAVLETDEAVTNFGITRDLDDEHPLVQVPRADFSRISDAPEIIPDEKKRRTWKEKARLVIQKAWFTKGAQKWQFQWNNVPLSAPIKDDVFWSRVENHEIVFGNGDGLDVELEFEQDRDEAIGMWVNDVATYRVTRVVNHISRGGKQETF